MNKAVLICIVIASAIQPCSAGITLVPQKGDESNSGPKHKTSLCDITYENVSITNMLRDFQAVLGSTIELSAPGKEIARVTASMKAVPPRPALEAILDSLGCEARYFPGVHFILVEERRHAGTSTSKSVLQGEKAETAEWHARPFVDDETKKGHIVLALFDSNPALDDRIPVKSLLTSEEALALAGELRTAVDRLSEGK